MNEGMVTIWLVLLILFLIAEASSAALVSIWFVAGAVVALVASLLGAEIWLQVTLFFVISAAALLMLRPLLRKYVNPKMAKTNVDALIGAKAKVTVAIDNDSAVGQVKVGAMEWSARSTSGKLIEVGTMVQVDRVEGVKLYVTPEGNE